MPQPRFKTKVGEIRPSQAIFSFGVGAIVDLPNICVMVMGLDDWDTTQMSPVNEPRLLEAVRAQMGGQVERLCYPPARSDSEGVWNNPFEEESRVGIPVAAFPLWMRCPSCHLLAPLTSGVFELKTKPFRPDHTQYVHINCQKSKGKPTVMPARFLVACENGHFDDMPWMDYVHQGQNCLQPSLRLREWGVSGSVSEVQASCECCGKKRQLRDAFSEDGPNGLPSCSGRHPHLKNFDKKKCEQPLKCILLGASNSWFPITLSALYIPSASSELQQLIEENWDKLGTVTSVGEIATGKKFGLFQSLLKYKDKEILEIIQALRAKKESGAKVELAGLKIPEWNAFIHPEKNLFSSDFKLQPVAAPDRYKDMISKVVLVERLREVQALIGFTRIDSPGNFDETGNVSREQRAPLSRRPPLWVPASEVRGEGIFIQFDEAKISDWCEKAKAWEQIFLAAHTQWRSVRGVEPANAEFPGIRYVLLHSFSHLLMRQISLECGYAAASLRERIYSGNGEGGVKPMAGILIYTGAVDCEGTLGGLVGLGVPSKLGHYFDQALEFAKLCASDPMCVEYQPGRDGISLHGAACHLCLFAPETSCEKANQYLDRAILVPAFKNNCEPFFKR